MAPSNLQPPKNWPPSLLYVFAPIISPSLTPAHVKALRTRTKDIVSIPPNVPKGSSPNVKINHITLPTHPANGQSGLFATRDLDPGTFILLYLGQIHCPNSDHTQPDPHAESDYDLSLDREMGLAIDAAKAGNEARFINDYRGIRNEGPNAEFRVVWDVRRGEIGMGVWVLPETKKDRGKGRGIKKGEEILVNYGRGFWSARRMENGSDEGET